MGTGVYVTRPTSGSLLTFWYKRPKNQPLCCLHFRLGAVAPGMYLPGFAWSSFLASAVEDHARRADWHKNSHRETSVKGVSCRGEGGGGRVRVGGGLRGRGYMYIADSLCYTAETHNTVKQLFSN